MHIAVLTLDKKGQPQARRLDATEIDEHLENVQGAITHLREYQKTLQGKTDAPDVPRLSSYRSKTTFILKNVRRKIQNSPLPNHESPTPNRIPSSGVPRMSCTS